MSWTETDNAEIIVKLRKLDEYERSCEIILNEIRDVIRGLKQINDDNPKDIDGSTLTNPRRATLKTNLMTRSDDVLPADS